MVAQGKTTLSYQVRFSQHTSVSFSHSTVQSEFSQYEVDRTFSQFSQGSVSSVTVIGKPNETNSSVSSVSSVSLNFSQFSLWVPDHGVDTKQYTIIVMYGTIAALRVRSLERQLTKVAGRGAHARAHGASTPVG